MFSQNEILLMILVVSVLLLVITILTVFDIVDYVKNKKKLNIENKIVDEEEIVPLKKLESVEVLEVNNDEVMLSDIQEEKVDEPLIEEVLSSDEPLFIEEVEEEKKVQNIDLASELNKALETIPDANDAITKFEEEQERTAIISLDELLKNSDNIYSQNELVQYDEGNEPISIDEVIERFNNEEKNVPLEMQNIVEDKEVYSHKESVPFISSLYGIEKSDNSLEFENTATYEKLTRSKNNEFMSKLREVNENNSN